MFSSSTFQINIYKYGHVLKVVHINSSNYENFSW
eukprot:UN28730